MHSVSQRIIGVGSSEDVSVAVVAARASANDFFGVLLLFEGATTMGREEGFPVEANSECQSKAMVGLVAIRVQNGKEKGMKDEIDGKSGSNKETLAEHPNCDFVSI